MKTKLLLCLFVFFGLVPIVHSQCSYDFYDTGGMPMSYGNNESYEVTYCPDAQGTIIYANFTHFIVQENFDGLYVYDGNSTSSPQISSQNPAGQIPGGVPGAYWGTQLPGPFTSTSPDGCLTFKFISNGFGTAMGWAAEISCIPIAECTFPPSDLTAANVSDTSVVLAWSQSGMANSWEVLALPCGSPTPTFNTSGIFTPNNPFVFTDLSPDVCYDFYVRAWCAPFDFSPWTGPANVMSNPVTPVCGGTYADSGGTTQNYSDNEDAQTVVCPNVPGEVVTVYFSSFNTEAENDALYVYDGNSNDAPIISSGNPAANVPGGLAGGFWGNIIPGPFTSTSPDGCLTFRFRSNDTVNSAGWTANITCAEPDADVIALLAFVDTNNNGIMDNGEYTFIFGTYSYEVNNSGTTVSGSANNAFYFPVTNSTDTYDLSFTIYPEYSGYYTSIATFNDVSITEGGVNYFYFPVQPVVSYSDLAINIIPLNNPQPGFSYSNLILFQNFGTETASGTLSFTKDQLLTINSISPSGTVTTDDGFTYNFVDLQPFEMRSFIVIMTVPTIPTVNLGDVLTNEATISGTSDDINIGNNMASLSDLVVGSYDPNDINESHGPQIVHSSFSEDDYLYYTIRFQNTGTANATFVRIENLLDSQLDLESLRMINASHEYTLTQAGNQLTWHFDDIQLPPEEVDEAASNGYVFYKIKPNPEYAIGDIIPSTAEIYFDFNPAIVTNTFTTEFVSQLSVAEYSASKVVVYPNPASDRVYLKFDTNVRVSSAVIYDIIGKSVFRATNVDGPSLSIDTSNLPSGFYTIVVNTESGSKQIKKLIIR